MIFSCPEMVRDFWHSGELADPQLARGDTDILTEHDSDDSKSSLFGTQSIDNVLCTPLHLHSQSKHGAKSLWSLAG
jgi:hypothetical protein